MFPPGSSPSPVHALKNSYWNERKSSAILRITGWTNLSSSEPPKCSDAQALGGPPCPKTAECTHTKENIDDEYQDFAMAKDRAAGSRSRDEFGFHGLGQERHGSLSAACGRIYLAIDGGSLQANLLPRLGGTRQQPSNIRNCRRGGQSLPIAHGRHSLALHRDALQQFLSRLGGTRQ